MNSPQLFPSESHFEFTGHALTRMAQRNLCESDVFFAMQHGLPLHQDGIVFYFLGQQHIPKDAPRWARRLEGTTVLLDPRTLTIITVYRNPKALRRIKRKADYYQNQVRPS